MNLKRYIPALTLLIPGLSVAASQEKSAGNERPVAYMVSDAHLDTQWNWDVQTTIKDYVWNTVNRNLKLFERYPDYIFNFEGGVKYAWIKEYYPREYELMKKRIAEGRWHVSGASWDANDVIVPSVESLIRNILLGQTFYRDEFGVESTDIFLPDCFGFGWTLPTVASHCGLIGFSSQKLQWRNNPFYGDDKYPFTIGLWQGVDGSRIMMTHGFDYTTHFDNEDLTRSRQLKERASHSPLNTVYHYYGTGDVGGAPTIQSVETVTRAAGNIDGDIIVRSVTSDRLYKDYLPYSAHPELPVFNGELTMDVHGTGCYTSQAAMKLYNRQNEQLAGAAEVASTAASLIAGVAYPSGELTDSWRRFIYHQFHDDLTGTSIPRAYEFSWNDELISLKQFAGILTSAVASVADMMDTRVPGTPVVLFNALGNEVTDIVEFSLPCSTRPAKVTVKDANGRDCSAQIVNYDDGVATVISEVTVPANGFSVIGVKLGGKGKSMDATSAGMIENSAYKLTFDSNGNIVSLVDKHAGKELVEPGKAIRLAMFENNKSYPWPAWEIQKDVLDAAPVDITGNVSVSLIEKGPLRSTVCVEKEYGGSKIRQYIRLYEGALADRIDFYNEVEWATTGALLKAEFPLTVSNPMATYDLGLGTIERGNNTPTSYEVYAQRWADLTDAGSTYGITVMNECKYGWDKPNDNTLRLTLLHTPQTDYAFKYQNRQDFGFHTFTYSLRPHSEALDKAEISAASDRLSQRIKAYAASPHNGPLGKTFSLASSDNPAIAIKALKKAESSDEYVVRVYETSGTDAQNGMIHFPFAIKSAVVADGTEKTLRQASFNGNDLAVSVVRNGIATYKITFDVQQDAESPDFKYLDLPFDKKCFSLNGFESGANFSEGFSYAMEIMPDTITSAGIPFITVKDSLLDGKGCKGDTLHLPDGNYDKLYILAATAKEQGSAKGIFMTGKNSTTLTIPSYTGFIGQWGHTDHTHGYLKNDEIGYVGTHRHSPDGDCPYEFTYMFKYCIDIPQDTRQIILPDNSDIVIFAATLAKGMPTEVIPVSQLFRTSNIGNEEYDELDEKYTMKSLINADNITAWSGYVNAEEMPRFMHDGNLSTKWCDNSHIPSYVDYDLGAPREIKGWSLTGAAAENPEYITSTCLLQTRNDLDEEWLTADAMLANKQNRVNRVLNNPVTARYVRLLVVQPEQTADGRATRICEFTVY